MTELFLSGRMVDLVLGLVALEAIALSIYHHRTGRGIATRDLAGNLLAGTCLLAALRCALVQSGWEWIALWLAASLIAHLYDIGRRWRR